jgi:hypothetical protein
MNPQDAPQKPDSLSLVVLRSRVSHLYFLVEGQWTSDIKAARNFQQVLAAAEFVRKTKLGQLDLVLHFGDPKYDITLRASE